MEQRLLCIRHGHGPTDDRITAWCALNGVRADIRRPFAGEDLGEVTDDLLAVVVYGGMYNAYDTARHPFLLREYAMIDAALSTGTKLLGICQGAQMIAHHLGAWVGAPEDMREEFGYYQVRPTEAGKILLPQPLHMCQAHFHTYDLPHGAVHLARSDLFEQQAFRVGERCYAFQFHAENTIEGFRRWQNARNGEALRPGVQSLEDQETLMLGHDRAQADWFFGFLDNFLAP